MKNTISIVAVIATAMATCLTSGRATADTLTSTHSTGSVVLTSDLDSDFTLAAFDPSLGTLTGVTLTLDFANTPEIGVLNISGGITTYTGTSTFNTILTGPDSTTVSGAASTGTLSGSVTGSTFSQTYVDGPVVTFSGTSSAVGPITDYEGTTPINFSISTSDFTSGGGTGSGGSGEVGIGGGGIVDATATVTYTFTAAPEPSTYALMLAGLGLLVWVRRSRGQQR